MACRNPPKCNEKKKKNAAAKKAAPPQPTLAVSSVSEGERLWRWCLFGGSTCIGFAEGYVTLGMPGDPLPQLRAMHQRLANIIQTLETRAVPNERQDQSTVS